MPRTRMFARVLFPALGAIAIQGVVAEEPAAPPAPPAKSIREWRTPASPATAPCPMAAPIASVSAMPATNSPSKPAAAVSKSPITVSIKSTMREGSLVILLDGVAVFNEKFRKPFYVISQTTSWDPLQVPAGTHRLTAKVLGAKKTYFSKAYDLQVPTRGAALRFVMQGDKLTVALGS